MADFDMARELHANADQMRTFVQDDAKDPEKVAALLKRAAELDEEADRLERRNPAR